MILRGGRRRRTLKSMAIGSTFKKVLRAKARRAALMARRRGPQPIFPILVSAIDKPELKFHDIDLDDAVIASGANVTASINLIAQGITETTRIGRKCTIKNIGWRFNIRLPSTGVATNTSDQIRVLMYLDKQANGATATNTDILETADFQSFNNLTNKGRFRTLMDRTYTLASQAGSGRGTTDTLSFGEDLIEDSFFKKVNIPIEFTAASGAITEITSNNIGVLLMGESGLAAFASKIRLRFTDK